jgi:putative dimethyl sulfoxide reductase chaperone
LNSEDKANRYSTRAAARRSVYDLLSAFYLTLPDRKMVDDVFHPDFEKELSGVISVFENGEVQEGLELLANFISGFKNKSREEILRRISVDRTRLFRGISEKDSPPPPYESVYREGRLCGESSTKVSRFYSQLGVTLPHAWSDSADYLGIELDFMRLLSESEEEEWKGGRPDKALELLGRSSDFLKVHLLKWVDAFCEKMHERAELDFYKGLARLTSGFLKTDSDLVEEQLKESRFL